MASLSPEAYMREAIAIAEFGYTAPNPLVGCLIVQAGEIVGAGFHRMAGFSHAEVEALLQAGDAAQGADVYVTLEPCAHQGRTPPCCDALIAAGVARVWIATLEPTKSAGGADRLRAAGINVEIGLLEEDAQRMNAIWHTSATQNRTFVTLKASITLDGKLARADGTSKWITNEESRRIARRLRAQHGAVVVGSGTVECDDPALTVRDVDLMEPPTRIVLDPSRRLADTHQVFRDDLAPTWRVVASAKAQSGDHPLDFHESDLDLRSLLNDLHESGIPGLLVEGGAATHRKFIQKRMVDRLDLFIAPKWFGDGLNWAQDSLELESSQLELVHHRNLGDDVWLRYDVSWPVQS